MDISVAKNPQRILKCLISLDYEMRIEVLEIILCSIVGGASISIYKMKRKKQ